MTAIVYGLPGFKGVAIFGGFEWFLLISSALPHFRVSALKVKRNKAITFHKASSSEHASGPQVVTRCQQGGSHVWWSSGDSHTKERYNTKVCAELLRFESSSRGGSRQARLLSSPRRGRKGPGEEEEKKSGAFSMENTTAMIAAAVSATLKKQQARQKQSRSEKSKRQ